MSTRQPTANEQPIIDEVLSLYQLKPTDKSYSHYRSDAVFHGQCEGLVQHWMNLCNTGDRLLHSRSIG